MKLTHFVVASALCVVALPGMAAENHHKDHSQQPPQAQQSVTHHKVTVEGHSISYKAVAGTIILKNEKKHNKPTAKIFYVAYTKSGVKDESERPVTFLYNGGPGSSSMWLHMGAFGPQRVITADHEHTPPAPYQLVNNDYSLLDASDLVFIDAPATGFSRIIGKKEGGVGKPKDFFGIDEDADAFAQFISRYLSKNNRWNSPKYLFGESYGTTRSAVLANDLQSQHGMDLNGVILLSAVLSFDVSNVDGPERNPGDPLPYALSLPTYAATAWYHHKLPHQPKKLQPFLHRVEHFAMTRYMQALQAGSTLGKTKMNEVAKQLHRFTGLPVAYLKKADLRVNGGEFEKNLLGNTTTTGRLDTRFAGPSMDPLSQASQYDPQSAAISSAYVSRFNNYVRKQLKFGQGKHYRPNYYNHTLAHWNFKHKPPGSGYPQTIPNVMPDLAHAMKYNPKLNVMLNSGYYDLATPFFAATYTMHHLSMEQRLQRNIQYDFYRSGHMVYVHKNSLKQLHDNVAKFIQTTYNSNQ